MYPWSRSGAARKPLPRPFVKRSINARFIFDQSALRNAERGGAKYFQRLSCVHRARLAIVIDRVGASIRNLINEAQ